MKRKLEMDDIRVGMYITILRGRIETNTIPGPDGLITLTREKEQYKGNVLEVLAIDMPYIVVRISIPRNYISSSEKNKAEDENRLISKIKEKRDTLDLRDIEVIALIEDYILKLMPEFQFNKDDYWDDICEEEMKDADIDINEIFKDL